MESERDRLQRYSDCDFLMQIKQNADIYLDRIFSNDHRKRETVRPSVHVAEVFSSPRRTARLVHRFGLTLGLAFDLRTGWDLNDPSSTCKNVVVHAARKANLDCWELEWTQCWDVTHEVEDGHIPLEIWDNRDWRGKRHTAGWNTSSVDALG